MANTYLIQRGDTLSKVAAMHHTTVKELLSLNPEIKNPDLIFAGTTIKVPAKAADTDTDSVSSSGVIQEIAKAYATTADKLLCIKPELINANVLGTGVQLVVAVENLASPAQQLEPPKTHPKPPPADGKAECTPREFVDVVFIPHKDEWRALTQEAKRLFDEEDETLRDAIKPLVEAQSANDGDAVKAKQEAIQRLTDLGAMESFIHASHEFFLQHSPNGEWKIKRYRELLLTRFALQQVLDLYDREKKFPQQIEEKIQPIRQELQKVLAAKPTPNRYGITDLSNQNTKTDLYLKASGIIQKWHSDTKKMLNDAELEISAYEQEAQNIAAARGYRWENGNYFSERAKQREEKVQDYLKARARVERSAFSHIFGFPQGLFESWDTLVRNPSFFGSEFYQKGVNPSFINFFKAVAALNEENLIVREQCLTPQELNGDPSIISVDANDTPTWEIITQEFYNGLLVQKKKYGVYQLEYIKHHALKAATERAEDMTSFLNANVPENMFERALSVYEAAIQELDEWKKKATKRVRQNEIQYLLGWHPSRTKMLVWGEEGGKWNAKPQEFAHKPGYKIIECYRNSTKGRPNYVRDSWLTGDALSSCYSTKLLPITPNTFRPEGSIQEKFEPGRRTEQLKRQINNALKNANVELGASTTLWEWEKGFIDTAEVIWSHKIAVGYSNRGGLKYDVSADAQMMRFTSGLSLSDTIDLVPLAKDQHISLGNIKAATTLDVFTAQVSGRLLLPDSCGRPIEINFYAGDDEKLTKHTFGHVIFELEATIGGYVGASCMLSANISVGADTGRLGLRGHHPVTTSIVNYNPHRSRTVPTIRVTEVEEKQPGVQAKVDLFAGIKVGGSFSGKVLWKPAIEQPTANSCAADLTVHGNKWITLCSLDASLAVAVGAGAKFDFCVTLADGRLAVVFAGRVIWGPGAEGAVGFTVDLASINDLVNYLLKVLAREDFRRLALFDDSNGSSYRYTEYLLTAHLITGITLAKLALFPIEVLQRISKSALKKENAPIVASYITGKDENGNLIAQGPNWERDREEWFDNLLPEVKGKLLHLLMTEHNGIFTGLFNDEAETIAKKKEANQRTAIVRIIGWISNEGSARYRQYEETLMRCNEDGAKPQNPMEQKRHINDTFIKIKSYFERRNKADEEEEKYYQKLLALHTDLYVNRPQNK